MLDFVNNAVRAQLDHPVIDVDGHMIEFMPVFFDFLKQVAGQDMVDRLWAAYTKADTLNWYQADVAERRRFNLMRPPYWTLPAANTIDRATAMLPRLMYERLPEMGLDFSVVYPTAGMVFFNFADEDLRRAACRAQNLMIADIFAGCEDRLAPAAVIPCFTPEETIEELDFAIGELGLKVPMFGNLVRRPLEPVTELDPSLAPYAFWVDTLAMDSPYDYDPVWQRCIDLGVPVTAHAFSQGIGMRRSTSSYLYNQTGHFADAGHAFAKSLFFGGVTYRFPTLKFAFLECGVAWAANLVCDLKERWEKRNGTAVQQFDPRAMDVAKLKELMTQYGGDTFAGKSLEAFDRVREEPEGFVDEFAATHVETLADLEERLIPNFYYGCEADDRMNLVGFDTNLLPFESKLKAIFSSDFGHWDVPDMGHVLAEAHEAVDDGLMHSSDFRDFVFTNPVELLTGMNRRFFQGTAVEAEVEKLLS